MSDWYPIETAPKCKSCLVYDKDDGDMMVGHFDCIEEGEQVWLSDNCADGWYHFKPSFWMPLPEPPKED